MLQIGKMNSLEVVKEVEFGLYLDGGDEGEILLPRRYVPVDWEIGGYLDVFIYLDSEDIPIATTETPRVEVGECAYLPVVATTRYGAFVNWGLSRDLLVPFKEQRVPMEEGRAYVIYCYLDKTGRIAASSRIQRHLPERAEDGDFEEGQKVDLLIMGKSDLGMKAVINGSHIGLIHQNEILSPIRAGQRMDGYIREIREDGRLNVSLQPGGQQMRDSLERKIMAYLRANEGICRITDKSSPDAIFNTFGVSKGNYKKALGKLYKQKQIIITPDQVTLK